MRDVLILGAGGQIARYVIGFLKGHRSIRATLFLRDAARLGDMDTSEMGIVEADVSSRAQLKAAMKGGASSMPTWRARSHARNIASIMTELGLKRLVFITSLVIYDEVPGAFGEWNRQTIGEDLIAYRAAADQIEASSLDYTIIRPAWLTEYDEVIYETTEKGEPFKGTEASRKSVAAYVVKFMQTPELAVRGSIGINKPGTDGDKPAFLDFA